MSNQFKEIITISRKPVTDSRGAFLKLFDSTHPSLQDFNIHQCNWVTTRQQFTLRGLHYQTGAFAEAKIFSVAEGKIQLCALDVRADSPAYKKSHSVILDTPEVGVLVPRGFATGYCTMVPDTTVLYFSDNVYSHEHEMGVRWNDPAVAIAWVSTNPILSEKDQNWPRLDDI